MSFSGKVAFISGGNRGIGFETARELGKQGYRVVLGARDALKGSQAVRVLSDEGIEADAVVYDAERPETEAQVFAFLSERFGKLDALVNNAGVLEEPLLGKSVLEVSDATLEHTFAVNVFAVVRLTRRLLPLLEKAPAGRIVNVSSILGSLGAHSAENSPIAPAKPFAYNATKTALNAFTVHLANALAGSAIKVNSIHPGWVKTSLGGEFAPDEIEGSGKTSARLASLGADGPTGGFFHLNDSLPW